MMKAASAALAAIALLVAAAPPAQAVAMYWTFRGVASLDDCLSRASYAAGVYGASNIERGPVPILSERGSKAHHVVLTGASLNISAMRRRVPGVVPSGSASMGKNARSAISPPCGAQGVHASMR